MGALLFVIGILMAFALMMGLFLILPFFLFLAGIVAMIVSDRRRGNKDDADDQADQQRAESVEVADADGGHRGAVIR